MLLLRFIVGRTFRSSGAPSVGPNCEVYKHPAPSELSALQQSLFTMSDSLLIPPYGGTLVNLLVPEHERDELRDRASRLPSIQISERSACDLQLLACGAFSPLDRFVGKADHERVLEEMRIGSGHIFPIPITLPISEDSGVRLDQEVAIHSVRNELLGIVTAEEIYEWDMGEVSEKVFGDFFPPGSGHRCECN